MGVVGCILGFLVVIYLCYKDWSVYIASIVGAAVVIAFNVLPFMDTLLGSYVNGMFVPIKSFFFLLLFGSIQSKIYSESGAAFSIADTIMSKLLRPGASNTKKNVIAVAVIVAIGIILCMGGINASVFIVLMYPVALTIFEYCDIPKRFILGVLAAASYTFTLTMPGSPQVTNVAAMTALGTAADVALVPGLVGAAVEVVVIIVLMNIYINKARAKGEHFELHPLDPHYDKNTPRPNFWIALIPLVPFSAKTTYGTGCFIMLNTGDRPHASANNLLATVAWQLGGKTTYALEGSVFVGGSVIQWLRDGLKLFSSSADSEPLAASVEDTGGVYLVPALTGLGAPYWDPYARGTIVGITRGTTSAHITRAALEAIAFEVDDVVRAMAADTGHTSTEMRVDGGAVANSLLMQFQADLTGVRIIRPSVMESTALGAAMFAGLAVGFWHSTDEICALLKPDRTFSPEAAPALMEQRRKRWHEAVRRSRHWVEE